MMITAIYTIGAICCHIARDRASTAIMVSGLINGVATILLVIFINPKIYVLADDRAIYVNPPLMVWCL
jgi:hypothetical protein